MADKEGRLKIGVVGAGWWATSAHIPGILEHDRAILHSVQNRSRDKAERIAKNFGSEYAFDDYRELISMGDLDAVVISSTPNVHFEQAEYALENGKHVLIEKPMTFTAHQARKLCDLAELKNLQLLVSCPWHYTRHGMDARKMISTGVLGNIKMISILMTNPVDKLLKGINTSPTHGHNEVYIEPNPGSYSDPSIAGGGQIYAQVSHVGAYLAFLTGSSPEEVYARFDYDGSQNDIYNVLTISMINGTLVNLASTGATPLNLRQYEVRIFGTAGILVMELWKGHMTHFPFDGEKTEHIPLAETEIYPDKAPVSNFIDAILGIKPNGSPGNLGLAAMEIIEGACISENKGKPIKISDL